DEDAETESDEDDIYKYKIRVHKDEDEEMINVKVDDSNKGDEEVIDAAKAYAEKTSEVKDDAKKTEFPPSSSSLSVSSGFGDQFFKLSFDSSLAILTPVQESPSKATVTTLPPPSVSTTPLVPQQTTTPIPTPPTITDAQIITTAVSESDALFVVQLRVAKLEKDISELKKIGLSAEALATLKTQVPSVVDNYLGSKVGDTPTVDLEQESEKTPLEILKIKREQAEKLKMPKFTIKSTNKAALYEYDLKSALYQTMHANKSFNINPANHRLYHAPMEALIEDENAMDKGVANTVQDHKRKHDDNEDDDDEDLQLDQTRSASAKEPVKEPIAEVVMDDAGNDVVRDDDQPQDASKPKTAKTLNPDWFKQPPMPPTPDPKWNKHQVILDQPEQPWFNEMITKTKAARYKIEGIEDMVPTLCSPTKVRYDKDALKGIKHWGEGRKLWHRSQLNKFSKHNNDIEDMLLLAVQHKLFNLTESDIVDFIMALRMFTRSLVIKKRVEDLQLGVESYQKKLNITPPQQTFLKIEFKELYTPSHKPPGVIYEDLTKQKRVMRADELYKFSDGTLKKVRDELHHRIRDFRLEYNKEMPRRKWTAIDRKRSELMVELIDKQMRERRIIQNLERLVGARELEMDYKLMTRTT
ncbi:hypothetical protein Tco_0461406, partial [Tanacetum coccineum]